MVIDSWNIFSLQAAVPNDVSELAFPDGEVEEPAVREEDVEYGFPYYLCKCSFEEYEDYWGVAANDTSQYDYAWCPCFQYDEYEGYEYAYETEWPSQAEARSLDRRKKKSKKHHRG